jgi:hypothetical protein
MMKLVGFFFAIIPAILLAVLPAGSAWGAYCTASGGCWGEYIDSVQVGSINNAFTGCVGYANYTSLSTTMERGTSYPILVSNPEGWSGDQCGIWVDWNHDQDFTDAGETITTSTEDYHQFTATITPPAGAVLGDTRMRIRIMYTGTLSPCGTTDYGEVEDYTINVVAPTVTYCTAAGGGGEYIDLVQVGTIHNVSASSGYADYTAQSTTMEKGTGYPIIITNGGDAYAGDQCRIWVDWNHDKDFADAGETITTEKFDPWTYTATITPPAGALMDETRMRIRLTYLGTVRACDSNDFGEVEDYTIDVVPAATGYCAASGGCREYIGSVQVGTIENVSTGCSGYTDYTSLSTTMQKETSYPILVTNGGTALAGDQCGIWVDWNHDNDFADACETIPTSGGPFAFDANITPPTGAALGDTRMRVRIMYTGPLSACGDTTYGEVEDYTINVAAAPTGYCGASGGCGEYIGSVQVGTILTFETGCSGYADYTSLSTTMERQTSYPIVVTNGGSAFEGDQCGIWVDWNQDEDFADAGETIATNNYDLWTFTASITPPAGAVLGDTRMRIRIMFTGPLSPCGASTFGEVEDYTINVVPAATGYCAASGGCREYIGVVQVRTIDNESANCTGYTDYTNISTTLEKGSSYPITVTNGGDAFAGDQCGIWIDWNQDHDFIDANEQVVVSGGPFTFDANIVPPADATDGATTMRIRIMYTGPLTPCGPTTYGEVEDYSLNVIPKVAAYCTASGGCGEYVESVEVGTISNTSTCNGYADYTHLATEMEIASSYPITVTNAGTVYQGDQCGIWIDWNQDADFNDAGESIATGGGPYTFMATITPPTWAQLGDTRMRIRIRDSGTLSPCGDLTYGEVEDYTITVLPLLGDFVNLDGVDFRDFAILAGQWQLPPAEPSADIAPTGGDGIVDGRDLAAFVENWLVGLE